MDLTIKLVFVLLALFCLNANCLPLKGEKDKRNPQGFYPGVFQVRPAIAPQRINGPPLAINSQPQFLPPRPGSVWFHYAPPTGYPQLVSLPMAPVIPQQRFDAPRPLSELPSVAALRYADKSSPEHHVQAPPLQPFFQPIQSYHYPQQPVFNPVPQPVYGFQPPFFHASEEFLPKKEQKDFKSCLDYLRHGSSANGGYTISDNDGDHFQVWCDFHSEPGFAWTLVMSHSLRNRNNTAFCDSSLAENVPVHQNSPNWEAYRLSKERMESLHSQSSHWRSTTGFPTHGVDYRDYVRGSFEKFDITKFEGKGECKDVDYVNIRGFSGFETKAQFWQRKGKQALHIDSAQGECPFRPYFGTIVGENNFGFYCEGSHTLNANFRGTENEASNTQWWFGGSMYDPE